MQYHIGIDSKLQTAEREAEKTNKRYSSAEVLKAMEEAIVFAGRDSNSLLE